MLSYIIIIVKVNDHTDPFSLVVKFFALLTTTVPPGLPLSMTFGIIFAL
jgi:magnesium-transporting ATPase (P-type)